MGFNNMEYDPPALAAAYFWKALRDRDVNIVFELLSIESKGFILGYLHSAGIIDATIGKVHQQMQAEEPQKILKELLDQYAAKLPLDHAPTNQAIYADDGIHATCKLISEDKYKNVVFIKPTELLAHPLPMIRELVRVADDEVEFQWRVDWLRLYDK